MKRKTVLILMVIVFVPFLFYLLNYLLVLEDQYSKYLINTTSAGNLEKRKDKLLLTIDVYEFDLKSCVISYYLYNDSGNEISLPCNKLMSNGYEGPGKYSIDIDFGRFPLYPDSFLGISLKKDLKGWNISKLEKNNASDLSIRYIQGVKNILSIYSFRDAISCVVRSKGVMPESWLCNTGQFFTNDYLKSIFLAYDLSEKIGDTQLGGYVGEEIKYLNQNKKEILKETHIYPQAYILKLVDIGLDKEYLQIIENFEIPTYEEVGVLNIPDIKSSSRYQSQNTEYLDILRYSDFVKIFAEYEYEDLRDYFLNELKSIYNSSDLGLNGLCSIGLSTQDEEIFGYLRSALNDKVDVLDYVDSRELINCSLYSKQMNSDIEGLNEIIDRVLERGSIEIEENLYLVDFQEINSEESLVLVNYKLLDNLMYILYEESI